MLSIDLNVGVARPFTGSGIPSGDGTPANAILTENSEPLMTESGEHIVQQESGGVWFFIEQDYNSLTNNWSSYL